MKTLIVIFVIIGSGYVSSHRGKRNVYQFGNMIECLTGREWSDYDGYGCWCGYGGSGGSVDSTDGCCRTHDRCYDNLVATGVCSTWQTYSEIYPYSKSCGTYPSVTCGIHDVLGEEIYTRKYQPFVCTNVQTEDFSKTSTESLDLVTSKHLKVLTTDVSTQDSSIALTTVASTQGSRDHTTAVLTTHVSTNLATTRVTTKSDTSAVSTAVDSTTDSTYTTTTDFTDPSTVGSTTSSTTITSSTEATTQDTTDVSTTEITIGTTTTSTTDQTTPDTATCPFGYSATFKDSCYKISNQMLSRSDARKLCESESAHLVFIESAEEDAFMIDVTSPGNEYWIGANGLPNTFYWDDGSEMVYKKFVADSNIAFDDQKGCYRMKVTGDESRWPDAPCFRNYNYICEYEGIVGRETKECPDDMSICSKNEWITLLYEWEQTAAELQDSVLAYFDGVANSGFKPIYANRGIHHLVYRSNDSSDEWCSFRLVTDCMTWKDVSNLNTSYALITNWLRWHEAVKACIFYDSHLVSVESEEESISLEPIISRVTINPDVWIGLSYSVNTGAWEWYRPISTKGFFNWADNQPNTLHSCAAIDHVTAEWKTKSCDSNAPFVCKRHQEG